jgi:hypothetical protein
MRLEMLQDSYSGENSSVNTASRGRGRGNFRGRGHGGGQGQGGRGNFEGRGGGNQNSNKQNSSKKLLIVGTAMMKTISRRQRDQQALAMELIQTGMQIVAPVIISQVS